MDFIKPMTESILSSNKEFFEELVNASEILEKKYGNISSFNFFRRNVGYAKDWEEGVMKARGLFLNNQTYEVVGRSYNKFFAINEKPETQIDNLKHIFKFPLTAYLKENGFLGILGYDSQSKSEIFASKASIGGQFAKNFERIFKNTVSNMEEVKEFLDKENVSMIFEVVDPINNPHIIEYDIEQVVLLDIVYREHNYRKYKYEDLVKVAERFGLKYKQKTHILNSWDEFTSWYNDIEIDDYLYKGNRIEGFVIEDVTGYMVKIKLKHYMFWKKMRKLKDSMNKRNDKVEELLKIPYAGEFYNWLLSKDKTYIKKDIISLRKLFNNENKINNKLLL